MSFKYGRELVERITRGLHGLFVIYNYNIGYPLFYNSTFQKSMYMLIKNIWLILEGIPYLPPEKKKLIEFKSFQSSNIVEQLNKYLGLYDKYYSKKNIRSYELDILEFIYKQVKYVCEFYDSGMIGIKDMNMPDYVEMRLNRPSSPIYETID